MPRKPDKRSDEKIALIALHAPFLLFVLLFALTLAGILFGAFTKWAWLLMVPLLAAIRGMFQRRVYTYRWLSLTLSLFLIFGLTELIANPLIRLWSISMVGLSVLLFIALVLGLRHAATFND